MVLGLFGIVLYGCVAKSVYPSESEIIMKESTRDIDKDGIPDQIIYVFSPKIVSNVSIQREIYVERGVGNIVTVRLTLISEASGQLTDISIDEIISPALTTKFESLNFTTQYSEVARKEPPISVIWKYTFSGNERIVKTIEYSIVVYQDLTRSWIEKNVRSPDLEVGRPDPTTLTLFGTFTRANDDLFNALKSSVDFYLAVAIYSAVLFFVFILILEILAVVGAFVAALYKRSGFRGEVYNWIGHGRSDNNLWVGIGVALIIIGSAIIMVTVEAPGSASMSTFVRIGSNLPKGIGSVIVLLGLVSVMYVMLDLVKGIIFGRRYMLGPLDIAKQQLDLLREKLAALEKRIADIAQIGIDTAAEELIHQIENTRAGRVSNEINDENVNLLMPIITKSISDVEAAIDGLNMKQEINAHWPAWSANIDELLSEREHIAPSDLINVPEQWRKWALTRYLGEHIGEAISLERGVLQKMKIAAIGKSEITAILADFMHAAKIEGAAIVRKDGLIISARLPVDVDQNLVAAIAAKVVANAEMVSSELGKGNTNFTVIKASGTETVIYEGHKIILIALVRAGEQTGYVISETERVMQKLNEMF